MINNFQNPQVATNIVTRITDAINRKQTVTNNRDFFVPSSQIKPASGILTPIQNELASSLTPQTIDLKNPENFSSFFHKVIEPRLQAKNSNQIAVNDNLKKVSITTNLSPNDQAPLSETIRLLRPTLNTQQITPTQQQFRLDIPFAKSASSDPNCKIPNGATVGINFTFF